MPITSSAKKVLRASKRKRVFNLARKAKVRGVVKQVKKLLADKQGAEARALMPKVQKELDKAVKTGLLKKNTASRKKSRLSAAIKKAQ